VKIIQRFIRKHQLINIARIELLSLYLHDHLPLLISTIDLFLISKSKDHIKHQHINDKHLKNIQSYHNRRKNEDRLQHLSNQFQSSSISLLFKDYSDVQLNDFQKIIIKHKEISDIPIKIKHFFLLEILSKYRYEYIKDIEKRTNTFIFTTPIFNYEQAQKFVHDGHDIVSDQIKTIIDEYDIWYRDLQRQRLGNKHPIIIEIDEYNRKLQQQKQQQLQQQLLLDQQQSAVDDNDNFDHINFTDENIANVVKGVISALDVGDRSSSSSSTISSLNYSKRNSRYNRSVIKITHHNDDSRNSRSRSIKKESVITEHHTNHKKRKSRTPK